MDRIASRKIALPSSQPKKKRTRPLEQTLQAHMVSEFDRLIDQGYMFTYAGDMNAARRTPYEASWAKVTGMKEGEPDVRLYVYGGLLILVEVKRRNAGSVSKSQRERHELLRSLGFDVRVARIKTEEEARQYARDLIDEVLPANAT